MKSEKILILRFLKKLFGGTTETPKESPKTETAAAPQKEAAKAEPKKEQTQNKKRDNRRDDNKGQRNERKHDNRKGGHKRDDRRGRNDREDRDEDRDEDRGRRQDYSRDASADIFGPIADSNITDTWEAPETVVVPEGKTSFKSLGLANPILHAIDDLGFEACTDIQAQILPFSLQGKDVCGKAQTGTGKTAAFLLATLQHFIDNPLEKRSAGTPRALILAPTRELALQIGKDAKVLSKYCDCNVITVIGGIGYQQEEELQKGRVDILVATPGRLTDCIQRRIVQLRQVEILILDEADRMLDMGFIPDVRRIIGNMPNRTKRMTQMFSATLNSTILTLGRSFLKDEHETIEIEPDTIVNAEVEQLTYAVMAKDKLAIILWYFQNQNVERMIIFCNRKDISSRISRDLYCYGVDNEVMNGDIPQKKRMSLLERFRSGETKVLVATDVAGRGIHVDNVSHVVNYDLPFEPEEYVHRVGRTGRAGAKGTAISFACEHSAYELPAIEEYIGNELAYTDLQPGMTELPEKVRKPKPGSEYKKKDDRRSGGGGGRSGGGPRKGGPRNNNRNRR